MKRPSPARLVLVGVLLAGVGLNIGAPSSLATAPSHKTSATAVSVDNATWVTSQPISAGGLTLYFKVTNTSTGSQAVPYGSFQLTVPTGIFVPLHGASLAFGSPANFNTPTVNTSATPETITVTSNGPTGAGIPPNSGSLTVVVSGTASAAVCPGTWGVEVKQSNDFSGTGNDFVGNNVSTPVSGGAKLVWTTQPTDTEFDMDMSPAPVVTLEDACGNPVSISPPVTVSDGATELKPPTVTVAGATATFGGVQFKDYEFTDTLTATANGISATSAQFNVFQFRRACTTAGPCQTPTLSGPLGETLVSIVTGSGTPGDVVTVDVKGSNVGSCNGTTTEPPLGEVTSLNVTNRAKTVMMTLPKVYVNQIPNNGTPFMDICLDTTAAGTTFTDKSGHTVSIGLIPDCTATGNAPPCVSSRKKNAGNEIITANLPAGDPHTSWY